MDYVLSREFGPKCGMQEWAEKMGVDRTTAWRWLTEWEQTGLIQRCRRALLLPAVEEVIVANRRAIAEWADILQKQIATAKGQTRSDHVSLMAAAFVWEKIIQPQVEQLPESGSDEADYIKLKQGAKAPFDPMRIGRLDP